MSCTTQSPSFVTLGMFIIDEFSFLDKEGLPTGRSIAPQESQGLVVTLLFAS